MFLMFLFLVFNIVIRIGVIYIVIDWIKNHRSPKENFKRFKNHFSSKKGKPKKTRTKKSRNRKAENTATDDFEFILPDDEVTTGSEKTVTFTKELIDSVFKNWEFPDEAQEQAFLSTGSAKIFCRGKDADHYFAINMVDGDLKYKWIGDKKLPEIVTDYNAVAFSWMEDHQKEIDRLINDAIGKEEHQVLLSSDMLPDVKAWEAICSEFQSMEIEAITVNDGIKITC